MLTDDALRSWLELPHAHARKAQEELCEPASLQECCKRVRELLTRMQAAGLHPDVPWMGDRPLGYAVLYLRCADCKQPHIPFTC